MTCSVAFLMETPAHVKFVFIVLSAFTLFYLYNSICDAVDFVFRISTKRGNKTLLVDKTCRNVLTTDFLWEILQHEEASVLFQFDYYKRLSSTIPTVLDQEEIAYPVSRMDQVFETYDWIQCQLVHYWKKEVDECIKNREGKLRLFFIGDSRARQLLEANLEEMNELFWLVGGDKVLIDGNEQPNLLIDYYQLVNNSRVVFKYFSTILTSHLLTSQEKIIERNLQEIAALNQDEFPDLILISFMQWQVLQSSDEVLRGFDFGVRQMRRLSQILEETIPLLKERGATFVWLLVDDIKNFSFSYNQGYNMEIYNEVVIHFLRPLAKRGLILLWDTGFPVSLKVFEDCERRAKKDFFSYNRLDNKTDMDPDWKCSDFSHAGPQATRVHIQFLYNFVCNRYLQTYTDRNLCCTS